MDDAPEQAEIDDVLRARLDALCAEGWTLWERFDREVRDREFHPFVASDYDVVRRALVAHRRPGLRFLELGSATGVITVMADLLGFDASGIEFDASLVATARALASRFQSGARFVTGSFLPAGYRWPGRREEQWTETSSAAPSGYVQLGRALDDFDVVFVYPWSGEESMMVDLMKRFGRADALLLMHDIDAGVRAYRGGRIA